MTDAPNEDVVPLSASAIRARFHPKAILGVWVWQGVVALVGTWPAVALVRGAYGRHPHADAWLWDGEGLALLDLVSHETNGIRAAVGAAIVALLLGATAGLLPIGALTISMAHATREGRAIGASRSIGGAIRTLRPWAGLLIVIGIAQGLAAAAAVELGRIAEASAHVWLGEAHAQELGIALGCLLLLPAVTLGVVHDLARAAVVRFGLGTMRALGAGMRTFRAAPISATWAWAWRGATAVAPVVAVAAIVGRIGGRGGVVLLVVAVVHQGVAFFRVAMHASWLAKALRIIRPPIRLALDDD